MSHLLPILFRFLLAFVCFLMFFQMTFFGSLNQAEGTIATDCNNMAIYNIETCISEGKNINYCKENKIPALCKERVNTAVDIEINRYQKADGTVPIDQKEPNKFVGYTYTIKATSQFPYKTIIGNRTGSHKKIMESVSAGAAVNRGDFTNGYRFQR